MSREQPKIYSTSRFIGLLKAKELSSVAARGGVEVVGSSGKLPGGVLPMLPIEGGWGDVTATTSRAAIAERSGNCRPWGSCSAQPGLFLTRRKLPGRALLSTSATGVVGARHSQLPVMGGILPAAQHKPPLAVVAVTVQSVHLGHNGSCGTNAFRRTSCRKEGASLSTAPTPAGRSRPCCGKKIRKP